MKKYYSFLLTELYGAKEFGLMLGIIRKSAPTRRLRIAFEDTINRLMAGNWGSNFENTIAAGGDVTKALQAFGYAFKTARNTNQIKALQNAEQEIIALLSKSNSSTVNGLESIANQIEKISSDLISKCKVNVPSGIIQKTLDKTSRKGSKLYASAGQLGTQSVKKGEQSKDAVDTAIKQYGFKQSAMPTNQQGAQKTSERLLSDESLTPIEQFLLKQRLSAQTSRHGIADAQKHLIDSESAARAANAENLSRSLHNVNDQVRHYNVQAIPSAIHARDTAAEAERIAPPSRWQRVLSWIKG